MKNKELNICLVSLAREIKIIQKNIHNFEKIYNSYNLNFFIICPSRDKKIFELFKNKNVSIINEDEIITFSNFKNIFNLYMKKSPYLNQIQSRVSWYYQQCLKISFIFYYFKIIDQKGNLILWDADTIIIKKIKFFNKEHSIKYGNVNEFFKAYYHTAFTLLQILPNYFVSSLNQFTAISKKEYSFLSSKLQNFIKINDYKTSEWIAHLISKSVLDTHSVYNGSLFSEYEIIGISNILCNPGRQKLIKIFRNPLDGELTNNQIKILKIFNFFHITYEYSHYRLLKVDFFKNKQSWKSFLLIFIRYLWKYYFKSSKSFLLYHLSKIKLIKKDI